jgi:hypothetical protein
MCVGGMPNQVGHRYPANRKNDDGRRPWYRASVVVRTNKRPELKMPNDPNRHMLRHFIAALAYRGANVLGAAPPSIADFRPHPAVRSPREILNHVNGVLTYAHSFLVEYDSTEPPLVEWTGEVKRFFDTLEQLDASIADEIPIRDVTEERLLQGPLADAMLHLGQIGIFRRMAGSPVAAENYVSADIVAGRLRRVT